MNNCKSYLCTNNKNTQLFFFIFTLAISYLFVHIINKCVEEKSPYLKYILPLHTKCVLYVKKKLPNYILKYRGKKYFWFNDSDGKDYSVEKKLKKCLFTLWSISHYVLYFIIGFLSPQFFICSMCISIFFEIYEYYKWECQDLLDIFINFFGFLSGYIIRKTICCDK